LNEFDKSLEDGSKKIENFFAKRERSRKVMPTSTRKCASTGQKNYMVWKPEEKWENKLRGSDLDVRTQDKKVERTSPDSDLKISQTKLKLRSTIAAPYGSITENTPNNPFKMSIQHGERMIDISKEVIDFGEDYKHDDKSGHSDSPTKKTKMNKEKEKRE